MSKDFNIYIDGENIGEATDLASDVDREYDISVGEPDEVCQNYYRDCEFTVNIPESKSNSLLSDEIVEISGFPHREEYKNGQYKVSDITELGDTLSVELVKVGSDE